MSSVAEPSRKPVLGCIADDVTGATDLAINLVQGGMCVVQLLGVPTLAALQSIEADAVVVALKTRSIPAEEAVAQSLNVLDLFRQCNLQRFFFKYCSTFDSTDQGNIGPVASALLDELDCDQTIFCPAFPRNGRTVYQGHLFVNDALLNESGMEHHPLNPMQDANLVRCLGRQVDQKVGLLPYEELDSDRGTENAAAKLQTLREQNVRFVVTDACDDHHLSQTAMATSAMPLLTGGSGIARYLPSAYRQANLYAAADYVPELPNVSGRALIVSGSCSIATNRQVAWMKDKCPAWQVDVQKILEAPDRSLAKMLAFCESADAALPLLIYSTAAGESIVQQAMQDDISVPLAIESFLAVATHRLVDALKIGRLVLAGGETSGAIVNRLGITSLRIGPEICAGVPWTESVYGGRKLALALKSGNFGSEQFFQRALELLA